MRRGTLVRLLNWRNEVALIVSSTRGPDVYVWHDEVESLWDDQLEFLSYEDAMACEDERLLPFLKRTRTRRIQYLQEGVVNVGFLIERHEQYVFIPSLRYCDVWRGLLTIDITYSGKCVEIL